MAKTLISRELFEQSIAPQGEIEEAIAFGKKIEFNDENGTLTAYLWNDNTYVTEMIILPEAFRS